jgi:26S proteasome regulatory subunit T5
VDLDSHRKGKCTVIKTSTRQTIFLPVVGLVDPAKLQPADLVGVNKDSYLILDMLPAEYDSRVKVRLFTFRSSIYLLTILQQAMEVDEKPSEEYSDIGGLDKQIQEVCSYIPSIHHSFADYSKHSSWKLLFCP